VVFVVDQFVSGFVWKDLLDEWLGDVGLVLIRLVLLGGYLFGRRRLDVRFLFGSPGEKRQIAVGVGVGALFVALSGAVIYGERLLFGWAHPIYPIWVVFPPLNEVPLWPFAAAVLVAPLYEETVYRSVGYRGLRQVMSIPIAAVLSSLLFAVGHYVVGFVPQVVTMSFLFGLASVALLHRAKSLWPSVSAHLTYNALVIGVGVVEAELVGWGTTLT
jgi:membrane protease YdiL (CAAX protease family)